MGQRASGVEFDSSLCPTPRLCIVVLGVTHQERLAAQYMVVSRQCIGTQSEGALAPGGLDLITQRGGDSPDDLILHCQDVDRVTVIVFGPQMASGRRFDQLRANSHAFANPANTAFGQVAHSQVSPHLGDVAIAAAIPE